MMFSSGKHAAVSHDPYPYVAQSIDFGEMRSTGRIWGYRDKYDPRPEFNRPLTNPANPILHAARLAPGANIMYADLPERPSAEQIEHAHKVLQRLARLREEA